MIDVSMMTMNWASAMNTSAHQRLAWIHRMTGPVPSEPDY